MKLPGGSEIQIHTQKQTQTQTQTQIHIQRMLLSTPLLPSTRMLLREKDEAAGDSMKFMTVAKELSYDNGQTPIINRRRSPTDHNPNTPLFLRLIYHDSGNITPTEFPFPTPIPPGTIKDGGLDEATLEVLNNKLKRLEMDNLHLKTQSETLKNTNAKLQVLEENTGKDKLVLDTNKAEITRLQDVINIEKQKSEAVQNKLNEAHRVLREIGYEPEKLNEAAPVSDRE
eukprot:sb/3469537/